LNPFWCDSLRRTRAPLGAKIQAFPYVYHRRESVDFLSGFLRPSKSGRLKIKEEE
jgi:hypothetical protein